MKLLWHLGHRENNYFDSFWQIKKHTLAGFLVLWVEKWLYP
jgi:hypothetical protein